MRFPIFQLTHTGLYFPYINLKPGLYFKYKPETRFIYESWVWPKLPYQDVVCKLMRCSLAPLNLTLFRNTKRYTQDYTQAAKIMIIQWKKVQEMGQNLMKPSLSEC